MEQKIREKNRQLQEKIKLEIEKVKAGQSKKSIVQLQAILTELQKSSMQKDVVLSYPRMIIDSWDYSDKRGKELMELAGFYCNPNVPTV